VIVISIHSSLKKVEKIVKRNPNVKHKPLESKTQMKLPAINCRVSSETRLRSISYGAVASPSLLSSSLWCRLIISAALRFDKLQGILAKAKKALLEMPRSIKSFSKCEISG
jgi:hypothetical protein